MILFWGIALRRNECEEFHQKHVKIFIYKTNTSLVKSLGSINGVVEC